MQEIRAMPSAENFLGWTTYSELCHTATFGPVVAINVSQYRCDGIIITRHDSPKVFSLPSLRSQVVEGWAHYLIALLRQTKDRHGFNFAETELCQMLAMLWRDIGHPLWQATKQILPAGRLSRVWLMPTGALASLPLHAALSDDPMPFGMQDVMITSYTPTLSALIRAQRCGRQYAHFRMLAIGSANYPGYKPLPMWNQEKQLLRGMFQEDQVTVLEDGAVTVDVVLQQLSQHRFLHICCHGHHDWMNPYLSHLALYDRPLTLRRISQQKLENADFAFLSACHTARVDPRAPDESVHLASGMNLAGFRSIIATMWGIADKDAPTVAEEVYSFLTRDGRVPDPAEAAEGLHRAVQALRRNNVPVLRWAPFIHIGM